MIRSIPEAPGMDTPPPLEMLDGSIMGRSDGRHKESLTTYVQLRSSTSTGAKSCRPSRLDGLNRRTHLRKWNHFPILESRLTPPHTVASSILVLCAYCQAKKTILEVPCISETSSSFRARSQYPRSPETAASFVNVRVFVCTARWCRPWNVGRFVVGALF